MFERARWCIRNPGACAEAASQRIRPEAPASQPRPERTAGTPSPHVSGYNHYYKPDDWKRREEEDAKEEAREHNRRAVESRPEPASGVYVSSDRSYADRYLNKIQKRGFIYRGRKGYDVEHTTDVYAKKGKGGKPDKVYIHEHPSHDPTDIGIGGTGYYDEKDKQWKAEPSSVHKTYGANHEQLGEHGYEKIAEYRHKVPITAQFESFVEGTKERKKRSRSAEQHAIDVFCAANPDQCAAAKLTGIEGKFVGQIERTKRDRVITEGLAREKKASLGYTIDTLMDSRPGRALQAAGDAYYEGRHITQHGAKRAGHVLEVADSKKYVPVHKKPPKRKKKTPRRYRMRATNAMDDVDSEMDRVMHSDYGLWPP